MSYHDHKQLFLDVLIVDFHSSFFFFKVLFYLSSIMSDLKATVAETQAGFHVEGYEKISYDFSFVDGVFDVQNPGLADCYKPWGRVLAVTDKNVFGLYGDKMEAYFAHYGLTLKVHKTSIGEKAKTIDTFLQIADSMTDFGIIRKVSNLPIRTILSA